jgi:hypothetical protein
MTGSGLKSEPLISSPIAALVVFSSGVAIVVFASLIAQDVDYQRARYSIWICVALGGWAIALLIHHGVHASVRSTPWRIWWSLGLAGYLVHLYWGYGIVYGGSAEAVFAGQGTLVASTNFALALLWAASVVALWLHLPAVWITVITAVLLCVNIIVSSLVFGRDLSPLGGAIAVTVWAVALYGRLPERKRT